MSAPAITSRSSWTSSMVRAIGPTTPVSANGPPQGGKCPVAGTRPGVGLRPQMPLKCAGTRIDPPPSLPTPPADRPAAMAAASPPLDSAWRAIERPRAVGVAVERVVGFPRHELLGGVGDAQDDGAGRAEPCDQRRVDFAADARAKTRAGFEGEACDGDGALDADGNAEDRIARAGCQVLSARCGASCRVPRAGAMPCAQPRARRPARDRRRGRRTRSARD